MRMKSWESFRRPGAVIVLAVFLLLAWVGIVALTLDGGLLWDTRPRTQAAVDSAALAAARQLYIHYPTIAASIDSHTGLATNPDPGGTALAAAQASLTTNGFDPKNATIDIPPKSGPFANMSGYVDVQLTTPQQRAFSSIWSNDNLMVYSRALAQGFYGGSHLGILVLDPSIKDALDANGSQSVQFILTGAAAVIVDSNNSEAARTTGSATVTAGTFDITGTNPGYIGTFNYTNMFTGVPPTPDPLRNLPEPDPSTLHTMSINSSPNSKTSLGQGNFKYVLYPGVYNNLPTFNVGDQVVLMQASSNSAGGIFYINGGGFKSTGASISMDSTTTGGLMIYNAPNGTSQSQAVQITGNSAGTVNLSPLTSGLYKGIMFFQERTSTVNLGISGGGTFNIDGTFYVANAQLQISGQGDSHIGSQYISRTLSLSGQGAVHIDYNDNKTAQTSIIRLVDGTPPP